MSTSPKVFYTKVNKIIAQQVYKLADIEFVHFSENLTMMKILSGDLLTFIKYVLTEILSPVELIQPTF